MYFYGLLLEKGEEIEPNKNESIKYLIKPANLGNIEAICRYSSILNEDEENFDFGNYKNAVYNNKRAKRRRSFNCIEIGQLKNFNKLDDLCINNYIDMEYGDKNSAFHIANILLKKEINDFTQQEDKIFKIDNVEAIKSYARTAKDFKKSFYILDEISSIFKKSYSKMNLARLILSNESFDVNSQASSQCINYSLAKKLSRETAECENLKGMILYGRLCLKTKKNKISEINNDFQEAFQYIKRTSKYGDAEAMVFISIFLYAYVIFNGYYFNEDKVKGAKYYKVFADLGSILGMKKYAECLKSGSGVESNREESLKYYKMAADNDDIESMVKYATLLSEGEEGSYDEAQYYYLIKAIGEGEKKGLI